MTRMHHCLTCNKDYECSNEAICKMGFETEDCGDCFKLFTKTS